MQKCYGEAEKRWVLHKRVCCCSSAAVWPTLAHCYCTLPRVTSCASEMWHRPCHHKAVLDIWKKWISDNRAAALHVADVAAAGGGRRNNHNNQCCDVVSRIDMTSVVPQIYPSVPQPVFTITEKAPTRAFSWLKAPTRAFTFKTLLRHYAKLLHRRPNFTSTYRGVNTCSA